MNRTTPGASLSDLTLAAVVAGDLRAEDIRIGADALEHQAEVADADGNPQLAENLRRAAELTTVADEQLLAIYDALRPRRSTAHELEALADELRSRGAVRCASLVEEALSAYRSSGLLRDA